MAGPCATLAEDNDCFNGFWLPKIGVDELEKNIVSRHSWALYPTHIYMPTLITRLRLAISPSSQGCPRPPAMHLALYYIRCPHRTSHSATAQRHRSAPAPWLSARARRQTLPAHRWLGARIPAPEAAPSPLRTGLGTEDSSGKSRRHWPEAKN